MSGFAAEHEEVQYGLVPTIQKFHECPAQIRGVVGPVGSGKTTGAAWDVCYYLPEFCHRVHGMK